MGLSLPEPKGHQRDVAFLNEHGHCVVLGTAGSGKTTMAVHRAHYLATAPGIGGRTLLVTFNKALVTYLKGMGTAPPNLQIETYHTFARGYLAHRTNASVRIYKPKEKLVEQALEEARGRLPDRALVKRPLEFFVDELHWLVGHGIDRQTYVEGRTRRVGRGKPLQQFDREVVFAIYQRYEQLRAQAGYEYDFDNMASSALTLLKDDPTARHYRHVVVDEGQDFTPEMIRSLAAAIPGNGSLTFFGDYAQQIYGSRMSWSSLGLHVPRGPVQFAHNYRNSRQIAQLAQVISEMPYFKDEVDLVQPTRPAADGPKPTILESPSKERQLAEAARTALALGADRQVAILMRTREHEAELKPLLTGGRVPVERLHRDLPRWTDQPGVFYGTYSAAKGFEFDSVILPFCDADALPKPSEVEAHGPDDAKAREGRQLYVAVTRARTELVILYSGKLTDLLPNEMSDLYVRVGS
ncbi:AAA family ATPase [Streptomyces sp. SID8361]|uniref:UvrD-helicase domain-containing protein n=1 Tax=Streptomyces sp. MnatMP-M27 TaxID=1839768 RepID=UPI00081DD7DF|nr:DEAD/DEAH box helicase [Streptomyces sp. MnatMP-M27]MYU11441.1 AAA family ATPase [Streptomyces sp. SID8361]SCF81550.1 Part of AAA domain-containing protein [Streptomyces sp. MnatMP-M27]